MSRGQSQQRNHTRGRGLEGCKPKGKTDDVIGIDSEEIPDIIIIDPPETPELTSPGSRIRGKNKTPAFRNIIYIDDDESDNCGSGQNGFEESRNHNEDSCSSTSSRSQSPLDQPQKCHPLNQSSQSKPAYKQGTGPSSTSLKSQHSIYRKTSPLDQQKFNPGPSCHNNDFDSCDNDGSDCEIMEDYQGNIRQQWEKASLRKKSFKNVWKGQSDDKGGATGFDTGLRNVTIDNSAKTPSPVSSNSNYENGNLSPFAYTHEDVMVNDSNHSDRNNGSTDFDVTIQRRVSGEAPVCYSPAVNETASESMPSTEQQIKLDPPLLCSNGNGPSDLQNYIIGNREMIKNTDAYKRAQAEEWAARHRALQIQAEEAQRLRKRRKAELRLLEMERRQKQRVEEVRQAQKKDEETLNLKEQLRIGIRRGLDALEASCRDMASLLHGLGITVGGGGFNPLPSEVRAAYKQALLRFHPDRASRSDIRQQIEAEEKFKLISRAKEKFML